MYAGYCYKIIDNINVSSQKDLISLDLIKKLGEFASTVPDYIRDYASQLVGI